MDNFYSEKTRVLTTKGFKKIKELENKDEIILLNGNTNRFEVVKDFELVSDTQRLYCYGINGRDIISTEDASKRSFFSLEYDFSGTLDDVISVNLNKREYRFTLYQYILLGHLLFNYFKYNAGGREFIFDPPINDEDRITFDISKITEEIPLNLDSYVDEYYMSGDIFTIKSDSFPNGVNTFIEVLINCILNNKHILKPFFDKDFIYSYGGYNKEDFTYYYLNLKNVYLEEIFCMIFNMVFGSGIINKKDNWTLVHNLPELCYIDSKPRNINKFLRGSGKAKGYNIKINKQGNYFMPSLVRVDVYNNFSFIPVNVKNV